MAAVTQTSTPIRHVIGDLVTEFYTFTGSSGDTLQTTQRNILHVSASPGSVITAVAYAATAGGTQLTLTASGPMTGENLQITSRVG